MAASKTAQPVPTTRVLGEAVRSLGWVVTAIFGLAAGGFVLHFPGSYGGSIGWEIRPGAFGLALGVANGVLFGVLLALTVGGGWAVARRVILFGALAVALTHALHDASSLLTPYPLVAVACGLCVALAWWLAIGHGPLWWPAVSGAVWAIGLLAARAASSALGLPWEETPVGWSTDYAVQGLIAGLLWGGAAAFIRPRRTNA